MKMEQTVCSRTLAFNPLNAELNPICHLLALLGGATIVVISRIRVKVQTPVNHPEESIQQSCPCPCH
jgi:hypothetical protein